MIIIIIKYCRLFSIIIQIIHFIQNIKENPPNFVFYLKNYYSSAALLFLKILLLKKIFPKVGICSFSGFFIN